MTFLVLFVFPLIFNIGFIISSVSVLHLKSEFDNASLLLPNIYYVCD